MNNLLKKLKGHQILIYVQINLYIYQNYKYLEKYTNRIPKIVRKKFQKADVENTWR